jgi:glycosyltransferase involved in cell wall biosynthesis
LGLEDRVHLLGAQTQLQLIYPGLDLLALTSRSEGTPNVLLEAMSCGVPCVATNAGDAALMIGDDRRLFPVGDADALAALFLHELASRTAASGRAGEDARRRMMDNFRVAAMVDAYQRAYADVITGRQG